MLAFNMLKKKYEGYGIMSLVTAIIGMIVLVVANSVGGEILSKMKATQTANSSSYNITGAGEAALVDVSDWYGTIVVIIIASFVLLLLVGQFMQIGGGA